MQQCVIVKYNVQGGSSWHEETLQDILSHEHSLLWPNLSTLPTWKLLVVPHSYDDDDLVRPIVDISFIFHHALIDGLSGPAFHYSLLKALNHPSEPKRTSPIIQVSQSIHLPLPVEDRLSLKVTYGCLISELSDAYMPAWMRRLFSSTELPWTGTPAALPTGSPYISHVRVIDIPVLRLNVILAYCRQARLSFTAVLHGIIVLCLSQQIPDAQAFVASTPYSVRSFLGTAPEAIVNQISVVKTTYPRPLVQFIQSELGKTDSADIYAIGRRFLDDLRESKAVFPVNNMLSLLQYLRNFHAYFRNQLGQRRAATFEVSNLGVFHQFPSKRKIANQQDWLIQRVLFTQAGSVVGNAISFNSASVEGGPLTISLTWQDGAVETRLAESLLQQVKESLDHLDTVP